MSLVKAQPLAPPEYRVLRSFEEGHSGLVELVESEIFGKRAVRKYIDLFGLNDALPYQEPRLLDEINHPRIVRVKGARFTELDGIRVVVFDMPYYEDGSVLTAFQEDHQFSILDAITIINDTLDALQYVHEQMGYLWRDAKPANLLLRAGRTRGLMADLGSAARLIDGSTAALGGSVIYRPSEYATGRLTVTSDLYSLGLALHEMLSGRFDYGSLDSAEMERRLERGLRAVTEAALAPAPHVPRSLRRIVHKATHPRPAKRYQSAAAFRSALTDVRVIDWRPAAGGWEGKDSGSTRRYHVHQTKLRGGRLRLEATRNIPPGLAYRHFGVGDAIVTPGDRDAYRDYFDEVLSAAFRP
jgi:eukaryotic-like serine/threonine-protein kinase